MSLVALQKIIRQENGKWHVYSEDGRKHLGGPYESKEQAVQRLRQVEGHKMNKTQTPEVLDKAVWSTAYVNDLPDSAFLYVESGEKDGEGKTKPRTKRHFPVKDKDGKADPAHVRNALARIPQSNLSESVKASAKAKAERMLASINKEESSMNKTVNMTPEELTAYLLGLQEAMSLFKDEIAKAEGPQKQERMLMLRGMYDAAKAQLAEVKSAVGSQRDQAVAIPIDPYLSQYQYHHKETDAFSLSATPMTATGHDSAFAQNASATGSAQQPRTNASSMSAADDLPSGGDSGFAYNSAAAAQPNQPKALVPGASGTGQGGPIDNGVTGFSDNPVPTKTAAQSASVMKRESPILKALKAQKPEQKPVKDIVGDFNSPRNAPVK